MDGVRASWKPSRPRSIRRRRWRSHRLLAALIALNVVAVIGGTADLSYVSLKSHADQLQASLTTYLKAGQGELEAGKEALKRANANHDPSLVTAATTYFLLAKGNFLSASQLADNSRFLRYLEYAPGVGQLARSRHDAVDGIAQMGAALADAGQDLSNLDGQLIKPPASSEAGRTLLNVIEQAHTGLTKVRGDLQVAQHAAANVSVDVLPSDQKATFSKARDSIDSALSGMDEFERLVPVLTDVFGGNGPRTYLIEQVNAAELRAGGGFIGSYSVLQANQGSLQVTRSGNSYDLADPRPLPGQPGFIPQPGPFREIIPNISWSFVDTNEFPDFPTSAQAAESFAQPRVGHLDAIISIDYYVVAKMLELTGPLQVPGYSLTVNSSNFIDTVVRLELQGSAAHKAVLAALAGPLMSRVAALPPDRWPDLVAALNGLAGQRHIQAYFNNSTAESEIDRIGWSGRVNPLGFADYAMEVESNYRGGKSNYFLRRQYTLVLTRNGTLLHHRLQIDFTNSTPSDAASTVEFVNYEATARLYVSANASSLNGNLRPVKFDYPSPPPGTAALAGWLPIVNCCGGRGEVVIDYDTPWPAHANATHEVYWQKEPGTTSDQIDVIWNDGPGNSYRTAGDLSQDRIIKLTPMGVTLVDGHPAQATLPSLSLG